MKLTMEMVHHEILFYFNKRFPNIMDCFHISWWSEHHVQEIGQWLEGWGPVTSPHITC